MLKFTVKPSKKDNRDFVYKQANISLAPSVDLREWDSLVEDQGQLGSCSGNALTNAYEIMVKVQYPKYFAELSRLFVYYNARYLENSIAEDNGVFYLRNALTGLKKYGVCRESIWPYILVNFDDAPNPDAYVDAMPRRIIKYEAVNTLRDMLEILSSQKPIVIGLDVFAGFDTLTKELAVVPLPPENTGPIGGHAMTIVGYSLPDYYFIVKNSYGKEWGDNGYCYLPFEYVRQYVFEKWYFDIPDQSTTILY